MAKKKLRSTPAPTPKPARAPRRPRKGKLSGGIIAISSAAIVSIYALGRANTSAGSEQAFVDAPVATSTAIAPATATRLITPTVPAAPGAKPAPSVVPQPIATQSAAATAVYKDGSYKGNGNSRHGGMEVTVVIKDGKIASANVTSCGTRYPCSDVDPLVKAAISKQAVPASRVSGATDSSGAYRQALTNALKLAKA